ncbi:hypothetical protein [Streptomyces laurentii]|uniref:hypothetical protein n=1 Tax=Streptomyces laurentii TaxID=39478 RepID=UPI0036A54E70
MPTSLSLRTAAVAALALFTVSCSGNTAPDRPESAPSSSSSSTPSAEAGQDGQPEQPGQSAQDAAAAGAPTPAPSKVRDAFAGLQTTLFGCADCDETLARIHLELGRLEDAMRNDPKGPGHFTEPLGWIDTLQETMGEQKPTPSSGTQTPSPAFRTYKKELVDTRDRVNTWMQGHPDDYR